MYVCMYDYHIEKKQTKGLVPGLLTLQWPTAFTESASKAGVLELASSKFSMLMAQMLALFVLKIIVMNTFSKAV